MAMGSGDPRTRTSTTKRAVHELRPNRGAEDGTILPTLTTRSPVWEKHQRRRKRTDGRGRKMRILHLLQRRRRRGFDVVRQRQMGILARRIHKGTTFQRIPLGRVRRVMEYGQRMMCSTMNSSILSSRYVFSTTMTWAA